MKRLRQIALRTAMVASEPREPTKSLSHMHIYPYITDYSYSKGLRIETHDIWQEVRANTALGKQEGGKPQK
jgi:hypothetical protein